MKKKRKKKRSFKRPKAGLKSRFKGRIISPYGAPTYHKGMVYDRLRHTVLTIGQMSEANKRMVQATLKTITTGPQAMLLPDGKNGWACMPLDVRARAYVISYHGIEVALMYQRQLTEVSLQVGDRYPEGVMQDPAEAWMRLDFLGLSAEKANVVLATQHKRLEEENRLLRTRVATLEDLNTAVEGENKKLKEQRQEQSRKRRKRK